MGVAGFDAKKAKHACDQLAELSMRHAASRWILARAGRVLLNAPALRAPEWVAHFIDALRTIDWTQAPNAAHLDLSPSGMSALQWRLPKLSWPETAEELTAEIEDVGRAFVTCAFEGMVRSRGGGTEFAWFYPAAFICFEPVALDPKGRAGLLRMFVESNKTVWPALPDIRLPTLQSLVEHQGHRLDERAVELFTSSGKMLPFDDPAAQPPSLLLFYGGCEVPLKTWTAVDSADPCWRAYIDRK